MPKFFKCCSSQSKQDCNSPKGNNKNTSKNTKPDCGPKLIFNARPPQPSSNKIPSVSGGITIRA